MSSPRHAIALDLVSPSGVVTSVPQALCGAEDGTLTREEAEVDCGACLDILEDSSE